MRSPWRWATALGLLAAMVAGAVVLTRDAPAGQDLAVASTTTATTAVTTTDATAPTSTVTVATTATTTAEQRLEEVRAIVQDLWYRWFDAIYRKDETVLWSIVANSERYDSALEAMQASEFSAAPTQAGVVIGDVEILLDRSDCLVVYSSLDVTAFKGAGAVSSGVDVLWADERYGWRRASLWKYRGDLWVNDCDLMEREATP